MTKVEHLKHTFVEESIFQDLDLENTQQIKKNWQPNIDLDGRSDLILHQMHILDF